MRRTLLLMLAAFTLLWHDAAQAQDTPFSVGVDVGAATTWDDEGLLGRGATVAGSVAIAATDRLTVRAVFDRVPYYRDTSWLRFDGHFDFIGAEVERRFRRGTVQPFVSGGGGVVRFSDTWLQKSGGGPFTPPVADSVLPRSGRYGAAVAGTGLDIAISPRLSLRPQFKVYLMGPESDLHPAMSLKPSMGVSLRW
jgi:hypothetical protein